LHCAVETQSPRDGARMGEWQSPSVTRAAARPRSGPTICDAQEGAANHHAFLPDPPKEPGFFPLAPLAFAAAANDAVSAFL
jgi:hypothetical protein